MDKKFDIHYSTEVEQKHFNWAKPYIHGPVKALLVPGIRFGREIVELLQRADIAYETVTIDRDWDLNKWGLGDFYHMNRAKIWDLQLVYKNLEKILTSDMEFDAMVLPGLNGWGHFSAETRKSILKRVENGTGLVLIKPFTGKTYANEAFEPVEELKLLSPLKNLFEEGFVSDRLAGDGFPEVVYDQLMKDRWIPEKHYITKGIPFELFPYNEMAYYPYEANGDVIIRSESGMPVAAVKEYGKGRIAAFGYYPRSILPQHGDFTGRESFYESIEDNLAGARHSLSFNYLEYFYGLLYRSMVWVAGKEPDCVIEEVRINDGRLSLGLTGNCADNYGIRVIDTGDGIVYEENGAGEIHIPSWLKLGGQYRADVFARAGDRVIDWSTQVLDYPLQARVKEIVLPRDVLKHGDILKAVIETEGQDARLEIKVLDDFDRELEIQREIITGPRSFAFKFPVEHVNSLHLRLRTVVSVDGHVIQSLDSKNIIITPEKRKLEDFEVFMNSQNRGQGDLWKLQREKSLGMGITGAFPGSDKTLAMSGAEGLGIYWYHRFPYVERKEEYRTAGERSFLKRVPCLNDDDFWKLNEKRIIDGVSANRKFGPVSYYANDEGSITCYTDEQDLCFCPHCMEAMREWLKKSYASLEELNETWGTEFQRWDEVEPYTEEEVLRTGKYASWGDHRLFMEYTFANAYKKIWEYIHKIDPEGILRMSGCQASTAYSGYDYYQLHRYIGYFEAYAVGNQLEFHRSFARPGTIIGGWIGYGAKGMTVRNRIWNGVFHGMTLISVFAEYSHINPDFTYFSGALDMGGVFKEIKRNGLGKLLLHTAERDSLGIAVHYSMPSIHGSYISGHKFLFENNRQGWINLLEDLGYQYNFVASRQIEAGELSSKGYKLLILPFSIALSAKEAQHIKEFVNEGGVVIGDCRTGLMDEHCRTSEKGSLDEVFGIERLKVAGQPFYSRAEVISAKGFPYFDYLLDDTPGTDNGIRPAETNIRVTTGKAGYTDSFSEKTSIVAVNRYGGGKGIYLNFSLDAYPAQRMDKNSGKYINKLMGHVLALSGVTKPACIRDADSEEIGRGYETIYYRQGSAYYVCVLRDLSGQLRINYDGLEAGNGDGGIKTPDDITLQFGAKKHVYDMRKGKYAGFTDTAGTEIAPGDTCMFSLLDYAVEGIAIETADRLERGGGSLRVGIKIISGKPEGEYDNVLAVNVFDPAGEYQWMLSENVTVAGSTFAKSFKVPYNAPAGLWKISVRDAASGVTAEKAFHVF